MAHLHPPYQPTANALKRQCNQQKQEKGHDETQDRQRNEINHHGQRLKINQIQRSRVGKEDQHGVHQIHAVRQARQRLPPLRLGQLPQPPTVPQTEGQHHERNGQAHGHVGKHGVGDGAKIRPVGNDGVQGRPGVKAVGSVGAVAVRQRWPKGHVRVPMTTAVATVATAVPATVLVVPPTGTVGAQVIRGGDEDHQQNRRHGRDKPKQHAIGRFQNVAVGRRRRGRRGRREGRRRVHGAAAAGGRLPPGRAVFGPRHIGGDFQTVLAGQPMVLLAAVSPPSSPSSPAVESFSPPSLQAARFVVEQHGRAQPHEVGHAPRVGFDGGDRVVLVFGVAVVKGVHGIMKMLGQPQLYPDGTQQRET